MKAMSEMKRIILFSGTTEGRLLSEELEKEKIKHTVCVATEYGKLLQTSGMYVSVHEGRMDEGEMEAFLANDAGIVIDATHPFAKEVSENIRKAAEKAGVVCFRLLRDADELHEAKDCAGCGQEDVLKTGPDQVRFFPDAGSLAAALRETKGNLLFTTGTKDLALFAEALKNPPRVYARVLPDPVCMQACLDAGILRDHIIAMQGPFTEEMNLATIRQFSIGTLITKESGKAGGFAEKIGAAKKAGIACFCIKRPEENGSTFEEVLKTVVAFAKENRTESASEPGLESKTDDRLNGLHNVSISIVGMGMGERAGLTAEALDAIRKADLLFGASRLLASFQEKKAYPYYRFNDILPVICDQSEKQGSKDLFVAVLFSGDIGFYSGAQAFETELMQWASDTKEISVSVHRYPGISSVSFLASRLGISYADAKVISLHGKNTEEDLKAAAKEILYYGDTFLLLSSGDDLVMLGRLLCKEPLCELSSGEGVESLDAADGSQEGIRVTVAKRLSYEDEMITVCSPDEMEQFAGDGLYTVYINNPLPQKKCLIPYLEDEELIRDRVPMTKELIRHLCIGLLHLKEGDVLYDIGSGTGSVSIEAAKLSDTLKVYAIEKNPDAIGLQEKNREVFSVSNVIVIQGEAPEALNGPEAPDAVFIGGSGGQLTGILQALKGLQKKIRIVITAVSLETMQEIKELYRDPAVKDLKIRMIQVSDVNGLGEHHLLMANNPVMIAAFDLYEEES